MAPGSIVLLQTLPGPLVQRPGVEFITEDVTHHGENLSKKTEFVLRMGAGYTFNLGILTLAPGINLDIVRDHTSLVAGLNVGYGF